MATYAEAEIKAYYLKYLQTKDETYLYKAKELADECASSDDSEVQDIVLKIR